MDFKTARKTWLRCKNIAKGYRLPGRNGATRLVDLGSSFGIKLYDTVVVEIKPDGSYVLENGGYQTVTTKDRIELYSPVNLFSSQGEWFVTPKRRYLWDRPERYNEKFIMRFESGMKVDSNGKLIPQKGLKVEILSINEFRDWERKQRREAAREKREAKQRELNSSFMLSTGTY